MSDPTTTNRALAVPTHGADVNSWDVPLNSNFGLLDTIVGGVAAIGTTGGSTTLAANILQCGTIRVTGALSAAAQIVFPAVDGWWTIHNVTTGGPSLQVVAGAGTQVIALPPGLMTDIQVNGNFIFFRNLQPIGTYLDVASNTVPLWINSCTVRPFLNCDGSTFSASTHPYLADFLGGTTLPDFRGRNGYYLNGTVTTRLTASGAGIDGNALFATGGVNGVTLDANQIPTITATNANQSIAVTSTTPLTVTGTVQSANVTGGSDRVLRSDGINQAIASSGDNSISATYTNSSQEVVGNAAPGIISGIRLIRAG